MKKHSSLLCLLLAMAGLFAWPASLLAADRPNILFLFSDDQQADAIHALGNEQIATPNIDRLVQSGMTFTRNYCMGSMSGAVCQPSRAMLMSGRTLFRAPADLQGVAILPQVLRGAGYMSFGTGKWHNGPASFARGFSHGKAVFLGGMSNHDAVPVADLMPDGKFTQKRKGEAFSSELFADAAIEFLKQPRGGKPFFAYVSFTAPHDPRMPPKKFQDLYDPAAIKLPANYMPVHPFDNGEMVIRDEKLAKWPRTPEVVQQHIAAYYAMITHMDEQIGRILDTLKETGQYDNTIIIFASDHGLAVGRHGLLGKQNLYEHSMRAPLVICGPGIAQGKTSDAFAYLLDLFPTVCQLADVKAPESVEGMSLTPILHGQKSTTRDSICTAYKDVQRALRTDKWKLIRYPQIDKTQLFDLENDPNEMNDLAGDPAQAENVKQLLSTLAAAMKSLDDPQVLTVKNPKPAEFTPPGG